MSFEPFAHESLLLSKFNIAWGVPIFPIARKIMPTVLKILIFLAFSVRISIGLACWGGAAKNAG
ncbi:hypothetical protein [Kordiimonas lipolytica]|uniref:hypothetical protein n=1 Tax=Kordiimonas lipolytica TaxID=1662421 RepID=UPI000B2AC836|nr:hypothetical protein [Kordiimonas lipolytica]